MRYPQGAPTNPRPRHRRRPPPPPPAHLLPNPQLLRPLRRRRGCPQPFPRDPRPRPRLDHQHHVALRSIRRPTLCHLLVRAVPVLWWPSRWLCHRWRPLGLRCARRHRKRNRRIDSARKVLGQMTLRDAVTWSSMLHGSIKCVGLEYARQLFDEIPKRETGCWTVMITGHVQAKLPVRALQLFLQMKSEGHNPNLITLVGVLSACADIGALDLGRVLHAYIRKRNVGHDVAVHNALIDMYGKSGNVEMACQMFDEMIYKDVFSWTTMISCLAGHGNGNKAMKMFYKMLNTGVYPNEVTFVGVLSACSHSGMIHEGLKWFEKMKSDFGLTPQLEHYGCMIDLFGRAGLLREAMLLLEKMDREPDAIIWRSLLSSCLVHNDVWLAEVAAREIISREPEDDGVYVLLWIMYASSNRWEEALDIRKKMWSRKVVKQAGCSWIEMDGFVHEFLVEDRTHFLRGEIYDLLEGIAKQLKLDGDVSIFDEDDFAQNHEVLV